MKWWILFLGYFLLMTPAVAQLDCAGMTAIEHFNWGQQHQRDEAYTAALNSYDCAIQLDDDLKAAYEGRAAVLVELGRYGDAMETYSTLIERESGNADLHIARGEMFLLLQDYDAAINDFDAAIELSRMNSPAAAYRGLGDAHYALDNDDAASEAYNRYVELAESGAAVYVTERLAELDGFQLEDLNLETILLVLCGSIELLAILIPVAFGLFFLVLFLRFRPLAQARQVQQGLNIISQMRFSQIDFSEIQRLGYQLKYEVEQLELQSINIPDPENEKEWSKFLASPEADRLLELLDDIKDETLQQFGIDISQHYQITDTIRKLKRKQKPDDWSYNEDDGPIRPF